MNKYSTERVRDNELERDELMEEIIYNYNELDSQDIDIESYVYTKQVTIILEGSEIRKSIGKKKCFISDKEKKNLPLCLKILAFTLYQQINRIIKAILSHKMEMPSTRNLSEKRTKVLKKTDLLLKQLDIQKTCIFAQEIMQDLKYLYYKDPYTVESCIVRIEDELNSPWCEREILSRLERIMAEPTKQDMKDIRIAINKLDILSAQDYITQQVNRQIFIRNDTKEILHKIIKGSYTIKSELQSAFTLDINEDPDESIQILIKTIAHILHGTERPEELLYGRYVPSLREFREKEAKKNLSKEYAETVCYYSHDRIISEVEKNDKLIGQINIQNNQCSLLQQTMMVFNSISEKSEVKEKTKNLENDVQGNIPEHLEKKDNEYYLSHETSSELDKDIISHIKSHPIRHDKDLNGISASKSIETLKIIGRLFVKCLVEEDKEKALKDLKAAYKRINSVPFKIIEEYMPRIWMDLLLMNDLYISIIKERHTYMGIKIVQEVQQYRTDILYILLSVFMEASVVYSLSMGKALLKTVMPVYIQAFQPNTIARKQSLLRNNRSRFAGWLAVNYHRLKCRIFEDPDITTVKEDIFGDVSQFLPMKNILSMILDIIDEKRQRDLSIINEELVKHSCIDIRLLNKMNMAAKVEYIRNSELGKETHEIVDTTEIREKLKTIIHMEESPKINMKLYYHDCITKSEIEKVAKSLHNFPSFPLQTKKRGETIEITPRPLRLTGHPGDIYRKLNNYLQLPDIEKDPKVIKKFLCEITQYLRIGINSIIKNQQTDYIPRKTIRFTNPVLKPKYNFVTKLLEAIASALYDAFMCLVEAVKNSIISCARKIDSYITTRYSSQDNSLLLRAWSACKKKYFYWFFDPPHNVLYTYIDRSIILNNKVTQINHPAATCIYNIPGILPVTKEKKLIRQLKRKTTETKQEILLKRAINSFYMISQRDPTRINMKNADLPQIYDYMQILAQNIQVKIALLSQKDTSLFRSSEPNTDWDTDSHDIQFNNSRNLQKSLNKLKIPILSCLVYVLAISIACFIWVSMGFIMENIISYV
ncbi:hypothetical protein NEAUS03_0366 [Nematocida ausubeli]|nr:hypothetical protein NEAUS03_0366 [Nematocida ausubeli]